MAVIASLDATQHVSKDELPLVIAKDLVFWFLVSFGKICSPIFLNSVL